jgi:branched-chain amino acid transport system ATP-binding protein
VSADSDLLLDVQNVRVEFGGLVAVNDVDFAIPRGAIVSLIGPNGAGKTTFFNIITGLYKPTSGQVVFDGTVTTRKSPHAIARLGMARTFQNIRLFGTMTAAENVMVAMHSHLSAGIWSTIFGLPKQRREEREARRFATELLDFVGIPGTDDEFAKNLPYGDQRRLEVARALALRPKLLLLDEPTAGMNPQESTDFVSFVRRVRDDYKLTILLIEHDMKVVMNVSERITVLDYGAKIAEGSAEDIRANERVVEAYLGKSGAATGGETT